MKSLDLKRIVIFLAFAFGIAWAGALFLALNGGLAASPALGPSGVTLAFLVMAIVYMGAPAAAHVLTRLVTREGWRNLYLRPNLRRGWPYWLLCWFGPGILVVVGMVVFFALFPRFYDPSLSAIARMAQQAGVDAPANLWSIVISQGLFALLLAPLLNALPTLGEEFGWRAYLQPKLMPLGGRRAMLLMGAIWGVWHWPVIAMGHNYGLSYPGAPWLGMLAMTWFTFLLGTCLGWATLRAGSVWPAVIGHAAGNGIAAIVAFFTIGQPNLLLGPSIAGVVGSAGLAVAAALIFASRRALAGAGSPPVSGARDGA